MGTKRIGLARFEALIEALKRDIKLGLGTGGLAGLHQQWNCNFGGVLAGEGQAISTLNVLTPGTVALNLSKQVEAIANQADVATAAQAVEVMGGTGVLGVDVAIGTTGVPGQTPTVTQRISRLTGGISGGVTMTAGADMTAQGDETLILFTDNVFSTTGVLKLTLATDNSLLATSSEIWVSGDGNDILTRQTAPGTGNNIMTLTDTGDCTILAGSYVYLHAGNASNEMAMKAVIRTSGGTVAVTFS